MTIARWATMAYFCEMDTTKVLIGDVGATSSDWALLTPAGIRYFQATGYNPVTQSREQLDMLLTEVVQVVPPGQALELRYYGAGAGSALLKEQIGDSFKRVYDMRDMEISSDLLAAARATCQDGPGVVCILGTGSNAGIYDGVRIVEQTPTLGYPLGDEGSGTDIGKRLVKSFYYGLLPADLHSVMMDVLPEDRYDFLKELSKSQHPNRFLAQFTRIAGKYKSHPYVRGLLARSFQDFITIHLGKQKKYQKINFVGSVAYYFCAELSASLAKEELTMGMVIQKPIEGLAEYHLAT